MIKQIAINGYDSNFSYFVGDDSGRVAVVDPDDVPRLIYELEKGNFTAVAVLITHSHFDHVRGLGEFLEHYDVPVYMHEKAVERVECSGEVRMVGEGNLVEIGDLVLKVLYTPGHLDDSICFYDEQAGDLITGDTVFVEGCGRTDLPGGNAEDLYGSLQRIASLPDSVKIYPGHDYGSKPVSTVVWEKENNRYFLCGNLEEFVREREG